MCFSAMQKKQHEKVLIKVITLKKGIKPTRRYSQSDNHTTQSIYLQNK